MEGSIRTEDLLGHGPRGEWCRSLSLWRLLNLCVFVRARFDEFEHDVPKIILMGTVANDTTDSHDGFGEVVLLFPDGHRSTMLVFARGEEI